MSTFVPSCECRPFSVMLARVSHGCKKPAAQMATVHWAVHLLNVAADEKGLVCATGADVYEKAIGR